MLLTSETGGQVSGLLFLAISLATAGAAPAEAAATPDCAMEPSRLDIRIPESGLTWLDGEASR